MLKTITAFFMLIFANLFIVGCVDINATSDQKPIEGECSLDINYTNYLDPVRLTSTNTDAPTIILIHGENGSPLDTNMQDLATDFNYEGYNVIMPYMAWTGTRWISTYCDSISYLNYLIVTENARTDKEITLIGYSLGATVSLAYTTMSNTIKPDTLSILAPSHFIHQSIILANANADSIALAKEMLENNQSQVETTFQTYSNGFTTTITTTPKIYLSFHDVEEFPNIESTTPLIRVPMLWLAGEGDPLTASAKSYGIVDLIPSFQTYKEIPGDHTSFLTGVSDEFYTWYNE